MGSVVPVWMRVWPHFRDARTKLDLDALQFACEKWSDGDTCILFSAHFPGYKGSVLLE